MLRPHSSGATHNGPPLSVIIGPPHPYCSEASLTSSRRICRSLILLAGSAGRRVAGQVDAQVLEADQSP
jgi:hypothetical protein